MKFPVDKRNQRLSDYMKNRLETKKKICGYHKQRNAQMGQRKWVLQVAESKQDIL